jgi:ubiquinone biosynthesis protein UbiJ
LRCADLLSQSLETVMNKLLNSIPSSMQIRAELEELVLNDLLGPVGN